MIEIVAYLYEVAGLSVVDRFLEEFDRLVHVLADNPRMGKTVSIKRPKVEGLRKFPVSGFDYIVFYLPRQDGISVVRVIHSSEDWLRGG